MANSYTYDSFGKLTASTGTVTNHFQFTGREFDTDANFYYYRARFYDPTAGRFLSEDPVGFKSESNFYAYVRNNPISLIDSSGLSATTGGFAPGLNTVVCDGEGGMVVQMGGPPPPGAECAEDCMRQHEERHIRDLMAANPLVCRGVWAGKTVSFSDPSERSATEFAASTIEIDCLRKKLQRQSCDANCDKKLIETRIKQMEEYRDKFKNK